MFERFTIQAREVVKNARREAQEMGHRRIGTEHLLLALLSEDAGGAYAVLHSAGMDRGRALDAIARLHAPQSLGVDDAAALKAIGIDLDAVRARVEESFGPGALQPPSPPARRGLRRLRRETSANGFSPRARKVIELSLREAIHLGDRQLGTEHILLGMIREGEGLAAKILTGAGLHLDELRRQTLAGLNRIP